MQHRTFRNSLLVLLFALPITGANAATTVWRIAINGAATPYVGIDIHHNYQTGQYWRLLSDGVTIDGSTGSRTVTGLAPTVSLTGIAAVFGSDVYVTAIAIPEPSLTLLCCLSTGFVVLSRRRKI